MNALAWLRELLRGGPPPPDVTRAHELERQAIPVRLAAAEAVSLTKAAQRGDLRNAPRPRSGRGPIEDAIFPPQPQR